ncbi:hypothetical protein BS47DRAFT_1274510, partial [Hydnum rufescens UP504]
CHTGHAHTGEFYRRQTIDEPTSCKCGCALQTRDHILLNCPLHNTHRHLLGKGRQRLTRSLLGTEKGISRLAAFLEQSGAYDKCHQP